MNCLSKMIIMTFLFCSFSGVSQASIILGVGYSSGSGSSNSGDMNLFSTATNFSDSTALNSSSTGGTAFIGYEGTFWGVRGIYEAPSRSAATGSFVNNGTTFGSSSTTLNSTIYGLDAYFVVPTPILSFYAGAGVVQATTKLSEAWTMNSYGSGTMMLSDGTVAGTATNTGSHAFAGVRYFFMPFLGLTLEAEMLSVKHSKFTATQDYAVISQASGTITTGNEIDKSSTAGIGFGTTPATADLTATNINLYLTASF